MNFISKFWNWVKSFFIKEEQIILPEIREKSILPARPYKMRSMAFGKCHNQDGITYKTLKVIPRSKRTKDNCNSSGVQNG